MIKVKKTNKEWKNILDDFTYQVTRESHTEKSFTGKYLNQKSQGVYSCICCESKLFSSKAKFDSGTGWPSFFEPINENNVIKKIDFSYGMKRIEVVCSSCEAHLGHVFEDGPDPSGLRYCLNSVSLKFKKDNE